MLVKSSPSLGFYIFLVIFLVLLLVMDVAFLVDILTHSGSLFVNTLFLLFLMLITVPIFYQLFFCVKFDFERHTLYFLTPWGWKVIRKDDLVEWSIFKIKAISQGHSNFTAVFVQFSTKDNKKFTYPLYRQRDFDVLDAYAKVLDKQGKILDKPIDSLFKQWKIMGNSLWLYLLIPRMH